VLLHRLEPQASPMVQQLRASRNGIASLTCTDRSSAPPHHPRVASVARGEVARVWDGETGGLLAELEVRSY
jgi:hypothetical protein